MNARLDDIRSALTTGHTYVGLCPDAINQNSRDWLCPACRVLAAIDQVLAGQVEANAYMIALKIVKDYAQMPNETHLQTMIAMAIGDAEARANHRALDIQYALDAEHRAHQPIGIDNAPLPDKHEHKLWFRRGVGWQAGYRCEYLSQDMIMLADGAKVPIRLFSHWMPTPPDPPAA